MRTQSRTQIRDCFATSGARYAAEPPESEEDTAASEDFEDAESASEALDEFTDVDPTVPRKAPEVEGVTGRLKI